LRLGWSLKTKIIFWFIIIIFISTVVYGFLIFSVYSVNLRGEKYLSALREQPGVDQEFIDRIIELKKRPDWRKIHPPVTILPFNLFMRIFYSITGGVLFIIILTASGGFILLMRMLNRVDFITRNVKEIDEKRLHLRLNLKGSDAISNMAKTFDRMLDKIENSFKNQKQFIQNASHELNTPLTVIKTKIDSLKQKKHVGSGEYKETLEIVDSEIMRLSNITEELLVLSELEDNMNPESFTSVDVRDILERILKLYDNQLNSRNLKIETDFKGKTVVWGNKSYIEQLLCNLLDNAVKYSLPNTIITINLENDNNIEKLLIKITNASDTIGKEDLPYIFERFYKSASGKDRKGFGLGLSISKKIVEKLKGSLEADFDSESNLVSFKITLPLTKNHP
jgi:two-component system, OmpR family, sensor histidine kinase ArlS